MGRIAVLPQTLINQIAAGEVIVRPASAAKELVENSLDAGATRITVQAADGGRSITIIDDGCGMDREDAELALQRHATSKIQKAEDLTRISTRGFRGEAVPSIASVARVTILTRPREELSGTRIVIEGGRIEEIASAGCPPGTRFEVRDLFYNTPARLKFLKTPAAELHSLMQTVALQALSWPAAGFTVELEGRRALDVPPGQTMIERVRSVWGMGNVEGLFPISGERRTTSIRGVLGLPSIARRDRRYQVFFVNRRPIVSRTLAAALEEAYRGLLMTRQHPIAALFIEVDPEAVDVNVHPTKEEVRFRNEREIASAVFHSAVDGLRGAQLLPMISLGGGMPDPAAPMVEPQESSEAPAPGGEAEPLASAEPQIPSPRMGIPGFFASPEILARPGALHKPQDYPHQAPSQMDGFTGAMHPADDGAEPAFAPPVPPPAAAVLGSVAAPSDSDFCFGPPPSRLTEAGPRGQSLWDRYGDAEPLGQVGSAYIAASFGDGLLLVDQHAAHERLLFIRLSARTRPPAIQPLLIPLTLDLAAADVPLILSIAPTLAEMGVEIEEFGGATIILKSIPSDLHSLDAAGLIRDLLISAVDPRGRRAPARELRDRILARMACRAAVKAGQRLSTVEMRRLLRDLRRERMAFTCPHGRPTMLFLARRELDRQFKRIVS